MKAEVEMLRVLAGHTNIVRLEEAFETDTEFVIVMEYCDGGDLAAFISRLPAPLPESDVLQLFAQIAMGVQHAHTRKVYHRDIKPQNIMLMRDGTVKVCDFGLATVLKSSATHHSKFGGGTLQYNAPELVADLPYDDRADVWALGCVLFELAARIPAFGAGSDGAIIRKIMTGARAVILSLIHISEPTRPY